MNRFSNYLFLLLPLLCVDGMASPVTSSQANSLHAAMPTVEVVRDGEVLFKREMLSKEYALYKQIQDHELEMNEQLKPISTIEKIVADYKQKLARAEHPLHNKMVLSEVSGYARIKKNTLNELDLHTEELKRCKRKFKRKKKFVSMLHAKLKQELNVGQRDQLRIERIKANKRHSMYRGRHKR